VLGPHRNHTSYPTRRSSDLHERTADGEHLLCAAAELLAAVVQSLGQTRKGVEDALVGPVALTPGSGAGRHHQVLAHAQVAEDARSEGHTSELQSREKLVCRL